MENLEVQSVPESGDALYDHEFNRHGQIQYNPQLQGEMAAFPHVRSKLHDLNIHRLGEKVQSMMNVVTASVKVFRITVF